MLQQLYLFFMKDNKIKLICLFIAIILWGLVKSIKISTIKINIPLQIEKLPTKIMPTSSLPKFVSLYIRGEKENLRFPTSNLKAILNLNSARNGLNIFTPKFNLSQLPPKIHLKSIDKIKIFFEKIIEKQLWVKVTLQGKPKLNYQVGQITIEPKRIFMSEPISKLKKIYEVYTQVVSVQNINQDLQKVVPLIKPGSLMSFINQNKVTISIRVFKKNADNKRQLENVPIQIIKANPNYNITLNKKIVDISLQGNRQILEEINISDMKVFINLDKVIPHEPENLNDEHNKEVHDISLLIPVEVELIRFQKKVSIVQVKPSELQVTFRKKRMQNQTLPVFPKTRLFLQQIE